MKTVDLKASSARLYWQIATAARQGNANEDDRDELECLRTLVDWPLLERRCGTLLAERYESAEPSAGAIVA